MIHRHNTPSPFNTWLRPGGRVILLTLFLVAPVYSQSLGDIAREELERKQSQPHQATHVYDNDDLARQHILLPEDTEQARAFKKTTSAPDENAMEPVAGNDEDVRAHRSSDSRLNRASETSRQEPKPRRGSFQSGVRARDASKAAPQVQITRSEHPSGHKRVRVEPGDTLWKLAYKYLGQGKDWLVLVGRNPQVADPQRLRVGTWLDLPDDSPEPNPANQVRVKSGDSLWRLTEARFGNGNGWSCVADANPQLHGKYVIIPGQILEIPDNCAANSLARTGARPPADISSPTSFAGVLSRIN